MLEIAGGKGGCGKTTTALGLAAALARGGDTTPLVADFDHDRDEYRGHIEYNVGDSMDELLDQFKQLKSD